MQWHPVICSEKWLHHPQKIDPLITTPLVTKLYKYIVVKHITAIDREGVELLIGD